jgi:hypothetical protein
MEEKSMESTDRHGFAEGIISAVSVGAVLVLIGIVFVINANLWGRIVDFFNNFNTIQVAKTTVYLPAPTFPASHKELYTAVMQFTLGVGILQILILGLRLSIGSRIRRTAQTIGSLVFWFGASYLTSTMLVDMKTTLSLSQQQQDWFTFWAAIIALIGFSLIVRAIVLFAARRS